MSILSMTLSASILILVVVAVRAMFLLRLPKITFLVLWGIVVCRLLVPYSIPSRFSVYTLMDRVGSMFSEQIVTPISTAEGIHSLVIASETPAPSVSSALSVSPLTLVWLAGIFVCALFFIVTHVRCRREYRTALPVESDFVAAWQREHPTWRPVQVKRSDTISAPLTYGIIKPVVLLPKSMDYTDKRQLRYVLAHEYTHVMRFDTLAKSLLAAALCVHWFNPVVWVMYVLANRDIELACDEAIVRTFGETTRSAYARTLITMEEKKSGLTTLCNNFSRNAIEERIVSIMKTKKTTTFGIVLALVLVVGTAAVFATSGISRIAIGDYTAGITYVVEGENDNFQTTLNVPTEQDLLSEYGAYGISFDEKGKMCFNGEPVRYFWDGAELDDNASSVYYEYLNADGTVDVHTTRNVIDNGDGSENPFGELIGIERYSQEEYKQRDLSDLKKSSGPDTYVADVSGGSGQDESVAQRFSKYKGYGIEYREREGGSVGNVYYNGQMVRLFIDENKWGGIFTYRSVDGGEIIVHTIYDENGKLVGVEKE
ncbi:beta-lactamase regulating signal transducer with metallopeptidase domain [Methanofollis sp. W23]|uniref:M56 family metallopeptidase n=1 Tax=Methanofollis sp. W23 TaxID=2817849 RepID=UPI001AE84B9F|nr:M56 family metallopeptidase [Methanofollis sp. W23]MBP2147185.1 beta-lactamase regulating signal transducer with metallopeptidase domain [Methanofollis sp. W23]